MNIEQFKMMMDAIGQAGDGALTAFMLWVGQGIFTDIATSVVLITIAWLGYKLIRGMTFGHRVMETAGYEWDSSRGKRLLLIFVAENKDKI